MYKLQKVWLLWKDLDQSWERIGGEATRIAFLKRLLNYRGSGDELNNFKALFADEIRDYSESEMEIYHKLMEKVGFVISVLEKSEEVTFDSSLTISELLEIAEAGFNFSTEKDFNFSTEKDFNFSTEKDFNFSTEQDSNFSTEKDSNFSTEQDSNFSTEQDFNFSTEKDSEGQGSLNQPGQGSPDQMTANLKRDLLKNFGIVKSSLVEPELLFEQGKLYNFSKIVGGSVESFFVAPIQESYVRIDSVASLSTFFTTFRESGESSDFWKSVYFTLALLNRKGWNPDQTLVFVGSEYTHELAASYKIGNVTVRKTSCKEMPIAGNYFKNQEGERILVTKNVKQAVLKNHNCTLFIVD